MFEFERKERMNWLFVIKFPRSIFFILSMPTFQQELVWLFGHCSATCICCTLSLAKGANWFNPENCTYTPHPIWYKWNTCKSWHFQELQKLAHNPGNRNIARGTLRGCTASRKTPCTIRRNDKRADYLGQLKDRKNFDNNLAEFCSRNKKCCATLLWRSLNEGVRSSSSSSAPACS